MDVTEIATAELAEMAALYNPRKISGHDLLALRRSLKFFGTVEPIVVNKRFDRIIGGHQRVKAAEAEGIDSLPGVYVDLDEPSEKKLNSTVRTLILWVAIFVVVIVLWNTFQAGRVNRHQLSFTEFAEEVEKGRVAEVTIRGHEVTGKFKDGEQYANGENFSTYAPEYPDLIKELRAADVVIKAEEPKDNPLLQFLFGY